MTQEEANQIIAEKLAQITNLLNECEQLAIEHKLTFHFDHAYAISGYFEGRSQIEEGDEEWYDSDLKEPGWRNSSSYC